MPQTEDMQIMPYDANLTVWFFSPTVDERITTVIFYSILLYNLHISLYTSKKKKKKRCPDLVSDQKIKKIKMFLNYQMVVVAR